MADLYICPDVHARTFYKPLLDIKDTHIVFLGDYVDPYPQEAIFKEEAIPCIEEIIEFKKKNPEYVHLLLGNHDCGYIWDDVCSSRRDYMHYRDIATIFKENLDLFDLAFEWKDDKNYLFTHAGVHKMWFKFVHDIVSNNSEISYDNIADYLNNILHSNHENLSEFLGVYSHYRGWGGAPFGSCVWADVREWFDSNKKDDEGFPYYQIFGHTQLQDKPIIEDNIACIDCRKYFTLKEIQNYGKD